MKKIDNGLFPFYCFDNLFSRNELVHFVSSGIHTLGFREGEDGQDVLLAREALAQSVGFSLEQLVNPQQVHSDRIAVVGQKEAGAGAKDRDSRIPETDGLITNEPGVCLMVMSADCVPVLLYDPVKRVIAAIHSGWRGTAAKIAGRAVEKMAEVYGSRPSDILAGIGPSIGKCCFEVGEEVAQVFRPEFPGTDVVRDGNRPGKSYVDLWEANRRILMASGLRKEHVEVGGLCTVCHHDDFFSYRHSGEKAGRFGAGIMLKS